MFCFCCLLSIYGNYFECDVCWNHSLCFKCFRSKSEFHDGHSFSHKGDERDDTGDSGSEASEAGDKAEPVAAEDSESDTSVAEFDDEIVG